MVTPHEPSVQRAAAVYRAAIHAAQTGDHQRFQQAFRALDTEDTDLVTVITGFIDFAHAELVKLGAAPSGDRALGLAFSQVDDDRPQEPTGADAVPPHHAWAGRIAAARIAGDQETFHALLLALPRDPAGMGQHVGALALDLGLTVAAAREQRHPAQLA